MGLLSDLEEMGNKKKSWRTLDTIHSLDLETTGAVEGKSRIWSFGLASNQSGVDKEFFFKDAVPGHINTGDALQDLLQAHQENRAGTFGQKQLESGSFDEYARVVGTGRQSTLSDASKYLAEQLKNDPSILLIQNAQFEDKRLREAAGNNAWKSSGMLQEDANGIRAALGYQLSKHSPITAVNDKIVEARRELSKALNTFKDEMYFPGKGTDAWDRVVAAKNSLSETMDKLVANNFEAGMSTVLDLMDVSHITQIEMAEKGLLDKGLVGYGRDMETLSKYLLGEKETHTALSDAQQQIRVFDKWKETLSALEKGEELPEGVQHYIEALNTNKDNIHDLQFLKQIRNRLEEAQHFAEEAGNSINEGKVSDILSKSTGYYSHASETNVNRAKIAENIQQAFKGAGTSREGYDSVINLIDSYADKIPQLNGNPLFEGNTKELKSAMSFESKAWLTLGAVAALSLISMSTNKKEKLTEQPPGTYNTIYDDVQLGSAYADWKDRNNAHRSIY